MDVFIYYIGLKGVPTMEYYRLQELKWKQDNDYPLTREEELLLIELNRKAIDLLDDWVNANY